MSSNAAQWENGPLRKTEGAWCWKSQAKCKCLARREESAADWRLLCAIENLKEQSKRGAGQGWEPVSEKITWGRWDSAPDSVCHLWLLQWLRETSAEPLHYVCELGEPGMITRKRAYDVLIFQKILNLKKVKEEYPWAFFRTNTILKTLVVNKRKRGDLLGFFQHFTSEKGKCESHGPKRWKIPSMKYRTSLLPPVPPRAL